MAFIGNQIITINSLLDLDGQELVLDADADSTIHVSTDDQIDFKIGGTDVVTFTNSSSDFVITQAVQDKDIIFKGDDNGNPITALTLDMSEAGAATFNNKIIATELDISGDIDVDGTANLDVVDIDGAVNLGGTLTFGDSGFIIGNSTNGIRINDSANSVNLIKIFDDGSFQTVTAGTNNLRLGLNAGNSILSGAVQNVVLGDDAGTAITTGDNNVCIGYQAGDAISVGDNNVAIGKNALGAEDGHDFNIAIGSNALAAQNAGADAYNIAIGHNAGTSITSGVQNTLIGGQAGDAITDADFNVAVGHNALSVNALGSKSVAIGHNALLFQNPASTADMHNLAVGHGAGAQITTGTQNTLIGALAGDAADTGAANVAVGYQTLTADTKGQNNVAIGHNALATQNFTSATNTYNTAVGSQAGLVISTGVENTLVGGLAGDALTDADFNTAIGSKALDSDTQGSRTTAVGRNALKNQNFSSATDSHNVAVGFEAGLGLTTGEKNIFVGSQAGGDSTFTGDSNTIVGYAAGFNLTSGGNNLFLGKQAGRSGSPSGQIVTGSNVVCLGDDNITSLHCADTSISSSDSRDKADITDFNIGLNWIKDLRPVTYKWDKRSWYGTEEEPYGTPDGSKKESKVHIGFLAQEVLKVEKANGFGDSADTMLTCNITEDKQRYGMKYERLVPVLVNAIKELSAKNDALEARIKTLEGS